MLAIVVCGLLSASLGLFFTAWVLALLAPLLLTVAVIYCAAIPDPLGIDTLWLTGLMAAFNLGYLPTAAIRFVHQTAGPIEPTDAVCLG